MKIFLDTTSGITVGLLDQDNKWLDYQYLEGQKGSAVIHKMILDSLNKCELDISDISVLFQTAGPGSYTGMRVSDGISQIFEWQNINTYSFYHFDIPKIIGVDKGLWFVGAFKGEMFHYEWNSDDEKKSLMKLEESLNLLKRSDIPVFTSFEDEKLEFNYELTKDMIYSNSKLIFDFIENNNIKKELYYFRTIDEEFSRSNK